MSRQLELHRNHIDQSGHRRPPSFNHKVGRLPIQGVSFCIEVTQTLQWIGNLQQGPFSVMPKTPKDLFRGGTKVDDLPSTVEALAIDGSQNRSPSRRYHGRGTKCQLVQHQFFDISKRCLPFSLEILTNGASQASLDLMVRVEKGQ